LRESEGGDNETHNGSNAKVPSQEVDPVTTQRLHIKRQQRNNHQQPHHVHECRGHQGEEPRRNLPHFSPKHIEQPTCDRAEQYAHEWRLERLGDVLLDQKHFNSSSHY